MEKGKSMKSMISYIYRAMAAAHMMDINREMLSAAWSDDAATLTDLIEAGADIHVQKDVALRGAAGYGCTETVVALLEARDDVHSEGDQALQWATGNGHTKTAAVLKNWMEREGKTPAPPRMQPGMN